jgi:hypothetical protein
MTGGRQLRRAGRHPRTPGRQVTATGSAAAQGLVGTLNPTLTLLSPNYGFPQRTCEDHVTVEALMDMGMDGITTRHPDRVRHRPVTCAHRYAALTFRQGRVTIQA